jgi:hypothetical protein
MLAMRLSIADGCYEPAIQLSTAVSIDDVSRRRATQLGRRCSIDVSGLRPGPLVPWRDTEPQSQPRITLTSPLGYVGMDVLLLNEAGHKVENLLR